MRHDIPFLARWRSGGGGAMRRVDVVVDRGCAASWPELDRAVEGYACARLDVAAQLRSWNEGSCADAIVVIVGSRSADGLPSDELVRELRRFLPHVAVYVCARNGERVLDRVKLYARAGADDLIVLDSWADARNFHGIIAARVAAPPPEPELRLFHEAIPASVGRTIGLYCLRNGHCSTTVTDLAAYFGTNGDTLANRLRVRGLPSPVWMLRWGYELAFRELWRCGVCARAEIARRLGVDTTAALRVRRRRLKGCDPGDEGNALLRGLFGRAPDETR